MTSSSSRKRSSGSSSTRTEKASQFYARTHRLPALQSSRLDPEQAKWLDLQYDQQLSQQDLARSNNISLTAFASLQSIPANSSLVSSSRSRDLFLTTMQLIADGAFLDMKEQEALEQNSIRAKDERISGADLTPAEAESLAASKDLGLRVRRRRQATAASARRQARRQERDRLKRELQKLREDAAVAAVGRIQRPQRTRGPPQLETGILKSTDQTGHPGERPAASDAEADDGDWDGVHFDLSQYIQAHYQTKLQPTSEASSKARKKAFVDPSPPMKPHVPVFASSPPPSDDSRTDSASLLFHPDCFSEANPLHCDSSREDSPAQSYLAFADYVSDSEGHSLSSDTDTVDSTLSETSSTEIAVSPFGFAAAGGCTDLNLLKALPRQSLQAPEGQSASTIHQLQPCVRTSRRADLNSASTLRPSAPERRKMWEDELLDLDIDFDEFDPFQPPTLSSRALREERSSGDSGSALPTSPTRERTLGARNHIPSTPPLTVRRHRLDVAASLHQTPPSPPQTDVHRIPESPVTPRWGPQGEAETSEPSGRPRSRSSHRASSRSESRSRGIDLFGSSSSDE